MSRPKNKFIRGPQNDVVVAYHPADDRWFVFAAGQLHQGFGTRKKATKRAQKIASNLGATTSCCAADPFSYGFSSYYAVCAWDRRPVSAS